MDRGEVCSKFLESITFDLYPYQEEALLAWFEATGGIMVCAPTGMGKTLMAEAAIFEALHTGRKLYYTTPLIALTDQKFREIQDLAEKWGFRREDIGLITGNRRENPDALVRVVVAEILLNHLLAPEKETGPFCRNGPSGASHKMDAEKGSGTFCRNGPSGASHKMYLTPFPHSDVDSVVMDEFHNFNDFERGIVWELSLVLLPKHIRVMLLSATVGNPREFASWLKKEHGRDLRVILSDQRRVPLEYVWIGDELLTEHLPKMVSANDADNRTPALVFCFNRDECWEVAERLKGLSLISPQQQAQITAQLTDLKDELADGVGPKLKEMLKRGVGVHHAGVLPKHKEIVESLFNQKLVPFVICTETLAAGINLPARSVVLSTLLKGKRGEKKLVFASSAHQMFGRAGRPQFDTKGYVYVFAHEDDAKIAKWRKKYDQLGDSKDPGILRIKKDLERKKPTRRSTEQYWSEGQFRTLIQAGPANLFSRMMIPYPVLIYLLTKTGVLHDVRQFLSKRFNNPERLAKFQEQLDFMIANLAGLGYLNKAEDADHVTLNDGIHELLKFRSIDPLFGMYLKEQLARSNRDEKILALEAVLQIPPVIERHVRIPDIPPGPLQQQVLEPLMLQMGVATAKTIAEAATDEDDDGPEDYWAEDEERPPTFPEMLKIAFEARLAAPEPVFVQPKWVAGGVMEMECDFYKFVRNRNLIKQEGLVLRHLLRLVILAGEFFEQTQDPEYQELGESATKACRHVDPRYTDRFLEQAEAVKKLQEA